MLSFSNSAKLQNNRFGRLPPDFVQWEQILIFYALVEKVFLDVSIEVINTVHLIISVVTESPDQLDDISNVSEIFEKWTDTTAQLKRLILIRKTR